MAQEKISPMHNFIKPSLIEHDNNALQWLGNYEQHVNYEAATQWMENRVERIIEGAESQTGWFLEHPSLYTAGTSTNMQDLLTPKFPVYDTGRGGQLTYHGPGQLICYLMLDLKNYKCDLKWYISTLEHWITKALAQIGIKGFIREGRVGIWVNSPQGEKKIAAIGVRVRKWVTFHGFSLNLNPDLSHYAGIVPCGIKEYGVTSLKELGIDVSRAEIEQILIKSCPFLVMHEQKYKGPLS